MNRDLKELLAAADGPFLDSRGRLWKRVTEPIVKPGYVEAEAEHRVFESYAEFRTAMPRDRDFWARARNVGGIVEIAGLEYRPSPNGELFHPTEEGDWCSGGWLWSSDDGEGQSVHFCDKCLVELWPADDVIFVPPHLGWRKGRFV